MMRNAFLKLLTGILLAVASISASAQHFVILSDIHVTPGNDNESELQRAITEINAGSADAVILSGDLTNEGSDEQLHHVKGILDGLRKPLYVIPGNHENTWSQSACKTFNDLWGNDRFVFGMGDSLLVVAMNCGPFMKMGDGHIKREDLIWLDRTLAERVKPGMKVLSVNHYPILEDLDNVQEYVDILKKYPVITHLCGHYHRWKQYETQGIMGVAVRALDMKNGNYGYTMLDVDLKRGWMRVYDKQIGKAPVLKYVYKTNTDFYAPPMAKSSNDVPAGFKIEKVFADEASIFTRVGVDEKNIYFGNSLGVCKAINKQSHKVVWQYQTDAMLFSRPVVDRKYIVLPTADKRLVWLNKKNGRLEWAFDAIGPYVADGVLLDGVLYQGGYKTMQAWDVKRRHLLWNYGGIDNYCQASPVVDGNDVIFGAWDTRLRDLDRKTGLLKWEWSNGVAQNLLSPGNVVPVVTGDKVVIVAPDRTATAINRKDGHEIWREKNDYRVRESLGMSENGKIAYAKTMDGELIAMDTQGSSYHLLWKTDLGLGYDHAPCIVLEHNGYIYCGSRRGQLVVVDAKTHNVVVSYKMGSSGVNGFELDSTTGDIYCSLIEGCVYRIGH